MFSKTNIGEGGKQKNRLNSTITITPEVLAGHQSSKGILLGADKEISIKELLRALIFLQAPEANKIALHWLETLSDKKDEPAKASEPEKKINGKSLLEDVGFVIRNLPKEVGQITDQTAEIQEKSFPSNIRISHSEKSDLLFILDNSSKVALGSSHCCKSSERKQSQNRSLSGSRLGFKRPVS